MDALITAAGRALATGDPLGALARVALRDDPPALALRGIAMAQLGEHARARDLLRRAGRSFGAHEAVARARCALAEAEVALALRDLAAPTQALHEAAATLAAHGDRANAWHARLVDARRALLLGQLATARTALQGLESQDLPPPLAAVAALVRAEVAMRSRQCAAAREALDQAQRAAARAGVPALMAEVAQALDALDRPVARRLVHGTGQPVRLEEVEALLDSSSLVLDACRRGLLGAGTWQSLASRPILFALARALAEGWPADVERDALIARAFRTRQPDETHRARLRVEIGRLRALVKPLAAIAATPRGFVLQPHAGAGVIVLVPPIDGETATLLALLADGAAWSTSALALALDASQRTVQRCLAELEAQGSVRAIGKARARRWLAPPLVDFAPILLLPASVPGA